MFTVDKRLNTAVPRTVVVARTMGSGKRIMTGRLEPLFKDSVHVALAVVGSRVEELSQWLDRPIAVAGGSLEHPDWDVHIGLPGSDSKKDGYSGGLAMLIALVGLTFGMDVVEGVALTGEVDLCGRVLDVGDVGQKIMGAHRLGMDKFIIPEESFNKLEVASFSADLQAFITTKVIPVSNILQALSHCFAGECVCQRHALS